MDVTETTVSTTKIKNFEDSVKIITDLLAGKSNGFELVPWKKFCKRWKDRVPLYCHFNILCLENTTHSVGWAMCNLAHDGACLISNGIKKYQPSVGNAAFHRHVQQHEDEEQHSDKMITVPQDKKKYIIEAAAKLCSIDSLPLNFCDKKLGMLHFATSLVELGETHSPSCQINMEKLLPCGDPVRAGVLSLCNNLRHNFKSKLSEIFRHGAGATCDGVKLDIPGGKYYDIVLHYLDTRRRPISKGGGIDWSMKTKLLVMAQHKRLQTALRIRENLNNRLLDTTGHSIEEFEKHCTFVTDCAATTPKNLTPQFLLPWFHTATDG